MRVNCSGQTAVSQCYNTRNSTISKAYRFLQKDIMGSVKEYGTIVILSTFIPF